MTDIRMTAERLNELLAIQDALGEMLSPEELELGQAMKVERKSLNDCARDNTKFRQRIRELEAELYEESAAGRAARLTIVDDLNQLQRKYDALVEKITMALDTIDAEPMALREPATSVAIGRAQVSDELRALLENDDD